MESHRPTSLETVSLTGSSGTAVPHRLDESRTTTIDFWILAIAILVDGLWIFSVDGLKEWLIGSFVVVVEGIQIPVSPFLKRYEPFGSPLVRDSNFDSDAKLGNMDHVVAHWRNERELEPGFGLMPPQNVIRCGSGSRL